MSVPFRLTKLLFDLFHFQKRRERGRITIKGIRLVEPAVLNLDGGDSLAPDVSIKIQSNFNMKCVCLCRRRHCLLLAPCSLVPFIDLSNQGLKMQPLQSIKCTSRFPNQLSQDIELSHGIEHFSNIRCYRICFFFLVFKPSKRSFINAIQN